MALPVIIGLGSFLGLTFYAGARHGIYGHTKYRTKSTPSERHAVRVSPGWLWTTVEDRTFNRLWEQSDQEAGKAVDSWEWSPSFRGIQCQYFIRPVKVKHNEDIYIEQYVPTQANRTF